MKNSIVIGDIHINNDYNYKEFFSNLIVYLNKKKYQYNNVIFLGDFIESISKINIFELAKIKEIIDIFLEAQKKIYILAGNHDLLKSKGFNIFKSMGLDYNKNIKVIDTPYFEDESLFLPYLEPPELKEIIENIDLKDIKFIYSHNDFKDIYYDAKNPLIDISVEKDILKRNSDIKFISGHIHNWFVKGNIYVLGCSFNTSFNDKNLNNVIGFIDDKGDIKLIKYKTILYLTFEVTSKFDIDKSLFILNVYKRHRKKIKFKVNSAQFEELKYEIENLFDKDLLLDLKVEFIKFVKLFKSNENLIDLAKIKELMDATTSKLVEDNRGNEDIILDIYEFIKSQYPKIEELDFINVYNKFTEEYINEGSEI